MFTQIRALRKFYDFITQNCLEFFSELQFSKYKNES